MNKEARIMIRMEDELKKRVEERAKEKGLTVSAWARMILIEKIMKGDK